MMVGCSLTGSTPPTFEEIYPNTDDKESAEKQNEYAKEQFKLFAELLNSSSKKSK